MNKVEEALRSVYNYSQAYVSGPNSKRLFRSLENARNTPNLRYEGQANFPISRPDILLFDDEFVYGIEHFEFDDYKRTTKGSKGQSFISKKEKDFQENFRKNNIPNKAYIESFNMQEETNLQVSYEHFVDNFLYGFNEHYKKIDRYKANIETFLKENNIAKDIKTCFLIENSSPMLPYCNPSASKDYNDFYIPFFSREIQEKIALSTNLDSIISLNLRDNSSLLSVYSHADGNINDFCEIVDKRYYCSGSKPFVMKAQSPLVIPKK